MNTGLEHISDKAIATFVTNLKTGVLKVVDMGPDALSSSNPKECPPAAAFENNMMFLEIFKAECFRRNMNYDLIGPDIREIEDAWLDARE